MQDVLTKETIVTLGTPVVYLSSLTGSNGVHTPPNFSYIQLYFMHEGQVINLYQGSHPHLHIRKSDLKISFAFDANSDQEDVGKLFEQAIIAEAEKMISATGIRIQKGRDASRLGFYHFDVKMERPVNGLVFDPQAFAHGDWFG